MSLRLKAVFLKGCCEKWAIASTKTTTFTKTTLLALILFPLLAQPASAECTFFSVPQRYNTQTVDDVIVIGDQSDRPYRVVVTGDDEAVLRRIQACVLDAFATRSKFGPFIQVGSFSRRRDAEDLRRILRREGFDARVTYRR